MRSGWYDRTSPRYLRYLKSKEWVAKRQQVIERCNDRCERCGKFSVAEVHHLTYVRVYREELEDLQGLCEFCHAFLHGESSTDGNAEYARILKEREEHRQRVERARFELDRLSWEQSAYRRFVGVTFSSHQEVIGMLRRHGRYFGSAGGLGSVECRVFDVRYAKRKYEPAVTCKIGWQRERWSVIYNVEEWMRDGRLTLDTERGLWINVDDLRSFLDRN